MVDLLGKIAPEAGPLHRLIFLLTVMSIVSPLFGIGG